MLRRTPYLSALFLLLTAPLARAQDQSMAGMPGMQMGNADSAGAAAEGVHDQMSGALMDSPHMRMTTLAAPQPGDTERADSIVRLLRGSIERFSDYRVALSEGYRVFAPKVRQKVFHFTNRQNALYAAFRFDPSRPTSLLYEKTDDGYKLVGAMYTAPRTASMAALSARVPLSVAQWHQHVNICVPPKDEPQRWTERANGKLLFGPKGSIVTEGECETAGGKFRTQLFGWMVHVNPWETDPKMVWGTHHHGGRHGDE